MHPSEPPTVERLTRALARLRARARLLLLTRWIGVIVGGILAVALVLGLIDFAVRMPMGVRVAGWCVWVALVILAVLRFVAPAARFKPRLTDMALRVERARPEVRGLLASAIDFAEHGDVSSGPDRSELSRALERRVVLDAEHGWRDALAAHLLRPAPALRAVAFAALAAVLALSPLAFNASLWSIGARRVFTPWSDASWPKRTGVADVTGATVHPLGTALTLRAGLTKANRAPSSTDVFLRYRLVSDGKASASRRELLTLQPQPFTMETTKGAREVPLFERRVEPMADTIEYRFETEDDQTAWTRISLVEPPGVAFAEATITPPEYVAGEAAPTVNVELGPGTDERAIAPGALVGSTIDLDVRLNKPARFVGPDGRPADGIEGLIDPEIATINSSSFEDGRLRASLTLKGSLRLPIALIDEHDIRSMDEAVFIFGASQDLVAGATITEPAADLTVLPTALVDVRAEGRDDVGLASVSVERQTFVPAGRPGSDPSGPGGATEPSGDPVELSRIDLGGERLTATVELTLDLESIGVSPGDEVHLVAIASDLFAIDGAPRTPTRSGARILRIIDEDRFIEEIQAQLSDVRQSAIRIEAQQEEVQTSTRDKGANPSNRRGQSQVSERIARQVESIDRLSDRIEQNRLDDEGLSEMLDETRDTLNRAGASASQASGAMDAAAAAQAEREEPRDEVEVGPEVERDQQRVRDELAQLIRMLDVGKDNWVVEKTLARILEEQKNLQAQASQMAAQTAGRDVGELNPGERDRLERIAQEQDELAQKLDDLLQEMEEREQALRENDPLAAMGMQAAAQRAQRDQTSQSMREASENASENQMANAGQQQQQAVESLEEMMEDLKAGDRKKDEVLRRLLLSIIESIDALILQQTEELNRFDDALGAGADLATLDRGMIALNQNTLGVVGQAREGGVELAQVADLLSRAGELQQRAVMGLRATPIDADGVRALEVQSLDTLEEAKRLAESVEERLEQQEMEQRKREMRQAYRQALEQQVALRSDIEPFTLLAEVSRRDRVRIRRSADPQEEIRLRLLEVAKGAEEFREARVYAHAHARLDKFATDAVEALNEGDPNAALPRQDAVIAMLRSIIESLKEPEPDESEFSESPAGGGGGGAQGGEEELVTVLGELTLLRSIQRIVAQETAAIDEGALESDERGLADLAQQQNELAGVAEDLVSRLRGGSGTLPPEGFEPVEDPENPDDASDGDPDPSDENDATEDAS